MAKISQASSKYIIHANIEIDGVVDRPDVVGAIFGQIEGLLGADLELRELQRSGRIGRIEVDVNTKDGKTHGTIHIPSSLDKAETAIVASALEIIERIGPCNAKISVTNIQDERIAKRQLVIDRAKQLLKNLQDNTLPDSTELSSQVSDSVRIMEIQKYGPEKLPAGPDIEEEEDIIVVEGRADVINLLKHGFKNVISINGTSVPKSMKELTKQKETTLFVDGDRGGDLIIKEMTGTCDVDYITKAPDGKEVEELQKKEIHQSLRNRVKAKDWDNKKHRNKEHNNKTSSDRRDHKNNTRKDNRKDNRRDNRNRRDKQRSNGRRDTSPKKPRFTTEEQELYLKHLKELRGRSSLVLDKDNNVLGKLSVKDLAENLPSLPGVHAVIIGGAITKDIAKALEQARPRRVIAGKKGERVRAYTILKEELEQA